MIVCSLSEKTFSIGSFGGDLSALGPSAVADLGSVGVSSGGGRVNWRHAEDGVIDTANAVTVAQSCH